MFVLIALQHANQNLLAPGYNSMNLAGNIWGLHKMADILQMMVQLHFIEWKSLYFG